jgi:TfoX/Sxy family transcriptional regulator of competence genes
MAKKMVSFSPELTSYLGQKIDEFGLHAEKKKMFGHETFFLNGYMFAGANVDGIYVHIGEEAKNDALSRESGVGPFEPMQGMVMKEYLLLENKIYSDSAQLKKWLQLSSQYLISLPPKKKKKQRNTDPKNCFT